MKCDICGSKETYIKDYKNEFNIKGEKIEFTSKRRLCAKCNSLVYDCEIDNETSLEALKIYSEKYGISKNEIINLRKKYNLSIELFAKIIGCAKKTLISYEQGNSIPNDIYLITFKTLISKPELILSMIDANKERFSSKEYIKITEKLNGLSKFDFNLLTAEDDKLTIYNGFTKLSFDKIKNIILYLAKDGILKTKLLKEMFYADFIYYKNTGLSITGLEYLKFNLGPVPNDYEKILNELDIENYIKQVVHYEKDYEYCNISSIVEIDKKAFTAEEFDVIEKVKKYFKEFGSKSIADFSHKEKAYTNTEKFEKISYDYAFDINDLK